MKGRWESMGSEGNGGTATWSELSNPLSPSPPFWCWDLLVCKWSFHISFFAYPGFTKPILCETIRTSPVAQRLRIHLQCRKPRFNPWVGRSKALAKQTVGKFPDVAINRIRKVSWMEFCAVVYSKEWGYLFSSVQTLKLSPYCSQAVILVRSLLVWILPDYCLFFSVGALKKIF